MLIFDFDFLFKDSTRIIIRVTHNFIGNFISTIIPLKKKMIARLFDGTNNHPTNQKLSAN